MVKGIGIAMAGYGFMGSTHLTAWSMVPEAKILAVIGRNRAKAKECADKYGAEVYTDLGEALKREDVDAVDICTPTHVHRQMAVEAAEAGKHILMEKPMALTLRDADEIVKCAREAGVKLMVAHILRFFAEYAKVKELVEQGVVGEPLNARAHRASPMPMWGVGNWFGDQERSGGVAVDLAIHDVDFLRWCLRDEVQRVCAEVGNLVRGDVTADDHALMLLRFRGGGIAHVEASWAMPQQYPFTTYLEIAGTGGILSVDNQSTPPLTIMAGDRVEHFSPETRPWVPGTPFPIDPYLGEMRHFAECVLEDKTPMTGGDEARRSLEVALAAVKSARIGGPVSLPLEA